MATTSLWPIHNTGGRGVRTILNKLVEYAENGEKQHAEMVQVVPVEVILR